VLAQERTSIVKRVIVAHIGAGTVGGAAIEQELAQRARWQRTHGIDVVIGAVIGGAGAVVATSPEGLDPELLRAIASHKRSGRTLAECVAAHGAELTAPSVALERIADYGQLIALDAGAGKATAELDVAALDLGGSIVLSNKSPLAMPQGSVGDRLWAETGHNGRVRYEATCGAGLPVFSTLRTLLETGDCITEITGTVSGTLGAIFSDVAAGHLFSTAVRVAKERGYTEPDPRDDLSGLDVARKALILARSIGMRADLDDLAIETLVPTELASVPIQQFLDDMHLSDESIAERSAAAAANGDVLKYVASVHAHGQISVGIEAISRSTVLGALQGPENIVSFRTTRYDAYPLTVTGPGAGAAVTAAGMIGDLLALACR
jgi:homoserine dehydrogenase